MARRVMIDPDGTAGPYLGLIVLAPTGVIYEQQCAGVYCEQREAEGYFVPLGGLRVDPSRGRVEPADLRAPFHDGRMCLGGAGRLPRERLARLKEALETIACWSRPDGSDDDRRDPLRFDESRVDQTAEAWVPVITPLGAAVLTWPNCD